MGVEYGEGTGEGAVALLILFLIFGLEMRILVYFSGLFEDLLLHCIGHSTSRPRPPVSLPSLTFQAD